MYYTGDLQSGIALALSESKSVACFVRDGGEESIRWENEHLADEQVTAALKSTAVTLRLDAQSKEANFLTAYYPVKTVPTLILIRNGQLTLELKSDQSKEAFKTQLLMALVSAPDASEASRGTRDSQPVEESINPQNLDTTASSTSAGPSTGPTPGSSPIVQASTANSHQNTSTVSLTAAPREAATTSNRNAVQNLLAERRHRLDVHKKEVEEAEKAERKAKADARKAAVTVAPDSAKAKQATYAQQQRKRNQEAKFERDRVLRQIEQDRADRREKEQQRRRLAKAEAAGDITTEQESTTPFGNGNGLVPDKQSTSSTTSASASSMFKECPVQVRLFDGTTLRHRFPSDQTLANVRQWVDSHKTDDVPYTFKQILSPLPNRPLTESEEAHDLVQLGFLPSATLVTVPIRTYTAAYSDTSAGLVSRGISAGYNTVAAGASIVTSALGTFLGVGRAQPLPEESSSASDQTRAENSTSGGGNAQNVRTLHDQHDKRNDHQLYNGNQINVEPRNDDREKDE